ncbi:Interleukin-12 subunit alpha [Channa argus]|uniref:Interleukin-12 subunit alpha n=1 Tax=Channa argus TaxID=215402 RepID=A0A6G1PR47_CHAAH|nr:Interleukin-12 subunit alpha [Channa argus]
MLLALSWRASTGAPVSPSPSPESCTQSSHRYKDLLLKITELLNNSTSGCVNQRQSSFSESECLMNIMKDLAYYEATITSYLESPLRDQVREVTLLMPTQETIKSLRTEKSAQQWGKNSFTNRQEMCKIMKGFYTRTITINRAMGYISSGDHRK